MPQIDLVLIGPKGTSAHVSLPNDVLVSSLTKQIRKALGLSRWQRFTLRRDDGAIVKPDSSLTTSRFKDGGRMLVELHAGREEPAVVRPSVDRAVPCYLVIDTSGSMEGAPIEAVNREIPLLREQLSAESYVAEVCLLSLVTFDGSARVVTPLTTIDDMPSARMRAVGDTTDYASVFTLLRRTIADDLYHLYLAGRKPYRPVVFFLSDGHHNQPWDWKGPLDSLAEKRLFWGAPFMIAFGYGDVSEEIIAEVGRIATSRPPATRHLRPPSPLPNSTKPPTCSTPWPTAPAAPPEPTPAHRPGAPHSSRNEAPDPPNPASGAESERARLITD